MLCVRGLVTYYGSSQALFGVELDVERGHLTTLLGRNGMGKTTTINSVMGIVPCRSGSITYEGREIARAPSFQIAKLGLGLVPEGRQVFPNLTSEENLIATAANRLDDANPWSLTRIYEMFPRLAERRHVMGNLLSGGEQQMLAIGRALMTNPRLLILDEATEGLAPMIREEIWACLKRIKADGLSILVVDKNIADLMTLADMHYVIEKGRIVWSGSSRAFAADTTVAERFLGV